MSLDAIGGAGGGWLLAALLLGIAELLVPGVFLIFLAIAAAVTGLASFALPELPLTAQLASFAAWSVVAVLVGRRWYADYPVEGGDAHLNDRASRLIGERVTVAVAIEHGRGRVVVGDGTWPATGPDLPVGASARIVAVKDGVVEVEAITLPST
ncbi:NfeD family protein [Sphingomonas rubra]|uniref:NfeD-like C-terminal domain-containing protein n=1 Tax=Sphingomonas rubra TaxID=634430 RepID=A0A1I5PUW4_9SPHN|nr:NfeD family protein [Sphingomonas rubra]SFP37426.1 hypothetical protein SAMN04488241_101223 [Sphingomonas rubra]